jgi:hypothetical protein
VAFGASEYRAFGLSTGVEDSVEGNGRHDDSPLWAQTKLPG